jgi:hypothetical protein
VILAGDVIMNSQIEVIENKLEKLVDDFKYWKRFSGEKVPEGYEEPKDLAKERKQFEEQIAELRRQLQVASQND